MKWYNWVLIAGIILIVAQIIVAISVRGVPVQPASTGAKGNNLQWWEWAQ